MNWKRSIAFVLAAVLMFSLVACGRGGGESSAELSVDPGSSAEGSAPLIEEQEERSVVPQAEQEEAKPFALGYYEGLGLNPYTCDNAQNQSIMGLLYEPLFEVDEHFEAQPCLAQSITAKTRTEQRIVEDKKKKEQETAQADSAATDPSKVKTSSVAVTDVSIKLRKDVKFSDGSTVRADDVKHSLQRAAAKGSVYQKRFTGINNLRTSGRDTVKFTIDGGSANVAELLDIPIIKKGEGDKLFPVGSGPYVVKCNKKGRPVRLVANETWWRLGQEYEVALSQGVNVNESSNGEGIITRTVALPVQKIGLYTASDSDELIFGFSSAQVTAVSSDLTGLDALSYTGSYDVSDFTTSDFLYVGCNTAAGPCQDEKLRQAIYRALDREKLVERMLAGHGQSSVLPVPTQSSLYDAELAQSLAYNRGEAKKLCKDAQVTSELVLIVNRESVFKTAIAKELERQLEDAGLSVKTKTMSWKEYREALKAGDYDLYLGEVVLGANFDLSALIGKKGSLNFSGYESKELAAAEKAYRQAGRDSRAAAASKLFTQLSQEAPFVPVCFKSESILSRTGTVLRLSPTQSNRFYHFWEWVLEEGVATASNEQ